MGVDIHAILQIKNDKGNWETVPEIPDAFTYRNYLLFDVLRDICNAGLPDEAKGEKCRYNKDYDYWEVDFSEGCEKWYYGFGWITLSEFKESLFGRNPYFVSVAFYDMFIELGGKFPDAMIAEDYGDNTKISFDVVDEDESDEIECLFSVEREFSEAAKLYGLENSPENIRVVFAFDC